MYHIAWGNMQYLPCRLSLAQTVQYLLFLNRIALERAKLYHKPPESYTTRDKVNPATNVLFLLSAPYNKRLILSLKFCKPPSFKRLLLTNATSHRG